MAERKKRFSGLYWQQFALTAGMVMLTLLLLGVSFFALSYNYNFTERRDELQERASLIAQVSVDYLKSGGQTEDENLKRFISLGSAMTNAEFLVCNDSGYALLTADQRLGGKVVAIPQEITQEVLTGSGLYQGRSSLGGAYTSKQFVVGVPVQDGDQTIGMVLAVMNARSVMGMWRSFISLFLMTSAIILLLVTYKISMPLPPCTPSPQSAGRDVIRLYGGVAGHHHRIALVSDEGASLPDGHSLVGNDAAQGGILFHHRALKEHAVLHLRSLLYPDTPKQDAVFHAALNIAAIGNEGILAHPGGIQIRRGRIVLLGQNGPLGVEQQPPLSRIQQLHAAAVVGLYRIDAGSIPLPHIGVQMQPILLIL